MGTTQSALRTTTNTGSLPFVQEPAMSDHPSCSAPNGATVTITIPPGWFTYVSGLARNSVNQMVRLRVTNSHSITNTEYLFHSPTRSTQTNETMKLRRTHEDSYSIGARADIQQLELTSYYSTDPKIKDRLLEKKNAVVSSLAVLQAETPKHLLDQYPDYITFFVFVQASPDQKETDMTPLYNDAVCMINMIKGTGLDHHGIPIDYDGSGGDGAPGGIVSEGGSGRGGSIGGSTTRGSTIAGTITDGSGGTSNAALDVVFVLDCTSNQQPYLDALTDNIVNIRAKTASSARLSPDALRLGLIGFRDTGDEYVNKTFPFTTNINVIRSNMGTLAATGGRGGPEALGEALDAALLSEWRVDATKLVILITDASLLDVGEPTNGLPKGSSTGKEPLTIARRMAEFGITVHLVVCEPNVNTPYKYASDYYTALTRVTGGMVLPLSSPSTLADYIIGSSLQRLELETLIAQDGKTIARRALFKRENPDALTEEYYADYSAAGVTVTTVEVEPVQLKEDTKEVENVESYDTPTGVVITPPLLEVLTHFLIMLTNMVRVKVLGDHLPPEISSGVVPLQVVSPQVTLFKKPISKEQTAQVIELAITKNAEVLASGKFVARPTSEDPVENSCRIDVPAGWYGFVSGLSRIKYNQAITLCYSANGITNKEYLMSQVGQADNIMRLRRTREGFYVFTASEESNTTLDISFFWSKDDVKGSALAKSQYASRKLKIIRTQTPMHSVDFFPDFITYLIMAEDQPEDEQVAGVPDFNDCVGIVNLIKKTLMVYNDET